MSADYQKPDPGWCGNPRRGAAMGRTSDLAFDKATGPLTIRPVPIDAGGYDPGGAYWGIGDTLFCVSDGERSAYLRAADLAAAKAEFPLATFPAPTEVTEADIADMLTGYIRAALWSSTDESDESGGVPLDSKYTEADLSVETRAAMANDCARFARANAAHLLPCIGQRGPYGKKDCTWASAGADLWLNRNECGCGFWDGDWPEPHDRALDRAAKKMGGVDLLVGNDGKIYQ